EQVCILPVAQKAAQMFVRTEHARAGVEEGQRVGGLCEVDECFAFGKDVADDLVLQRGQYVGDARKVQVEGGGVDVALGGQVHDLDACHRLRAQQLQHRRLDDALLPAAELVGALSHVFLLIDSGTEGALPLMSVFPRYILTKPKQNG